MGVKRKTTDFDAVLENSASDEIETPKNVERATEWVYGPDGVLRKMTRKLSPEDLKKAKLKKEK